MFVQDLLNALKGIDPKKEIVVIAGSHAFELKFVSDCLNDPAVMLQCEPPKAHAEKETKPR